MSLKTASPASVGIPETALTQLTSSLSKLDVHSVVVARNGYLAAEGWWDPYRPEYRHTMYSVSKTFAAVSILFLVQEGKLALTDRIVDIFSDKVPSVTNRSSSLEKLTVQHVLTMTTGHTHENTFDNDMKWVPATWNLEPFAGLTDNAADRVYNFLKSHFSKAPGTHYYYDNHGSYILGAIVHKLSGQNIPEFLHSRLFEPLDITDVVVESTDNGEVLGAAGFELRTRDMAKFGQFLLQEGSYGGKQLLSAELVRDLATRHTYSHDSDASKEDWALGYGYQVWLNPIEGSFRADGLWGQYIIVNPKQNAVVAITSGSEDTAAILKAVWSLFDQFEESSADNGTIQGEALHFDNLIITLPDGEPLSTYKLPTAEYEISYNKWNFTKIATDENKSITIWQGDKKYQFQIGDGEWIVKEGADRKAVQTPAFESFVAVAGSWKDSRTLTLKFVYPTTPYRDEFEITFVANKGLRFSAQRYPRHARMKNTNRCDALGLIL